MAVTAEPLERERAFSLHVNHMRSAACSRTQAVRFHTGTSKIRELRSKLETEPNQEGRSRTRAPRGWLGAMKMRFIRPTSRKSWALAPTHWRKKRQSLKLNVILQPAALA